MLNFSLNDIHEKKLRNGNMLAKVLSFVSLFVYAVYFSILSVLLEYPNELVGTKLYKFLFVYLLSCFGFSFVFYKTILFTSSVISCWVKNKEVSFKNRLKEIFFSILFYGIKSNTPLNGPFIFCSFVYLLFLPFILDKLSYEPFSIFLVAIFSFMSVLLSTLISGALLLIFCLIQTVFENNQEITDTHIEEKPITAISTFEQITSEKTYLSNNLNTVISVFQSEINSIDEKLSIVKSFQSFLTEEERHMIEKLENEGLPSFISYYKNLPSNIQEEMKENFRQTLASYQLFLNDISERIYDELKQQTFFFNESAQKRYSLKN